MKIEYRNPASLLPNPKNYRTHPPSQRRALASSLSRYGWIDPIIFNQRTGHLVDGHARIEDAVSNETPLVPVVVVDLSTEDEAALLACLDPITLLAEVDQTEELLLLEQRIRETGSVLPSYAEDPRALELLQNLFPDDGPSAGGGGGGGGAGDTKTLMLMIPTPEYDTFLAALNGLGEAWEHETYPETILAALERERSNA